MPDYRTVRSSEKREEFSLWIKLNRLFEHFSSFIPKKNIGYLFTLSWFLENVLNFINTSIKIKLRKICKSPKDKNHLENIVLIFPTFLYEKKENY